MNDDIILLGYAKSELSKESNSNSKKAYELKFYIACLKQRV